MPIHCSVRGRLATMRGCIMCMPEIGQGKSETQKTLFVLPAKQHWLNAGVLEFIQTTSSTASASNAEQRLPAAGSDFLLCGTIADTRRVTLAFHLISYLPIKRTF